MMALGLIKGLKVELLEAELFSEMPDGESMVISKEKVAKALEPYKPYSEVYVIIFGDPEETTNPHLGAFDSKAVALAWTLENLVNFF